MRKRRNFRDVTAEAVFGGVTPADQPELEPVARYLVELRDAADATDARPHPALATVLELGLSPTHDATVHRSPRRKKMLEIALAKLASLTLVAKAGLGVGVAVASIGGAGAAGVLPGATQDTVAGIVETVTPFDLPDSSDAEFGERVSSDATDSDAPGVDGPTVADEASNSRSGEGTDADESSEFGDRVSDDAADPDDPGVDGPTVADEASNGTNSDPGSGDSAPPASGEEGTDRADDTPAADSVPSPVPPEDAGSNAESTAPEDPEDSGDVYTPEDPEDSGDEYRPEDPEDSGDEYTPEDVPSQPTTRP